MGILIFIIIVVAIFLIYDFRKDLEKERKKAKIKEEREKKEFEQEVEDNMKTSRQNINDEIRAFAESINAKDYKDGYTGPFGLKSGQLRVHIQANKDTAENNEFQAGNISRVDIIPPKKFPLFDSYIGLFNPNAELVGVAAIRNRMSGNYNIVVNDMRAAFDKTVEMVGNNYGNGKMRIANTYEILQKTGVSIKYFNHSVANGDIDFTGDIDSHDSFANEQRFLNEDLDCIRVVASCEKGEDPEYPYEAILCLGFQFNNYPDELMVDSEDTNTPDDIVEKINLINESF